ncbi:hypothetical protein ABZ461_37405 [Actinacidiphila glaucinigra]|uniref:hypothetical protein n=1 Tax=Actinacidiphila glaucinigra TaxID=235986 RepID=UPI0033DEE392
MKKWVVPENSNKRVQRASRMIGKGTGTPEEIREARDVLSNYRLAQAFPLNAVTVTVHATSARLGDRRRDHGFVLG